MQKKLVHSMRTYNNYMRDIGIHLKISGIATKVAHKWGKLEGGEYGLRKMFI